MSESRVVWRIGDPEEAPVFNSGWFTRPDQDEPVFRVGTSTPQADWPLFHPGPLAGTAGFAEHGATILFDHPGDDRGSYELVIHVDTGHGPCPALEVELNGRAGRFFLRPTRPDRTRLAGLVSGAAGRAVLRVPLARAWLVAGENRLALITKQDPPLDPHELRSPNREFGWLFKSGLRYAGIELAWREKDVDPTPVVELVPLPLYQERSDGLVELSHLLVNAPLGFTRGEATIEVGTHHIEVPLEPAGRQFGQVRVNVEVPALEHEITAKIAVVIDDWRATVAQQFRPRRKWTIHVLPHVHLDFGFTDFQAKVFEIHSRNLDRLSEITDEVDHYAYSVDGTFILKDFLATRSEKAASRVRAALVSGQVSMNAFYVLFLSGIASLEECYKAAYLAAELRQDEGIPIEYANLTDVPSYSMAIPSIVRAVGADSFMGISNHFRAANADTDHLHMISPFRWQGPDGAEVLAYFSDSYAQLRWLFSDPPTVVGAEETLPILLDRYDRPDYLPDELPIVGTHVDNEDLGHGEAAFVDAWNSRYAYPRMRYSSIAQYFAAVRPLLDRLPLIRGDGGSYWEDGVGSTAGPIAVYRRAQALLPAAETLATLVGGVALHLLPTTERFARAWEALLFGCEHTWSSSHSVSSPHSEPSVDQNAWKVHQIDVASRLAVDEARRGMSQLAELVTTSGPSVVVFNPTSWTRSGEVEIELLHKVMPTTINGDDVPCELRRVHDNLDRIRLTADEVPPFGYRVYPLAPRPPGPRRSRPELESITDVIETTHHRLTFDTERGAVRSLFHKGLSRELLNPDSPWRLGEVLYVAGGGTEAGRGVGPEATSLNETAWYYPRPELEIVPATMEPVGLRRTPWGVAIELRGEAPTLSNIEVELRLRDDDDRVEIDVHLDKEAVLAKESVYVAFPFAMTEPTLFYDRQQGWVDPSVDHQLGACNEWFTTQFAVGLVAPDVSVTWVSADAPLFAVGDVVRGRWSQTCQVADGTLLSWVMNNYWSMNYVGSQGGRMTLRYAFRAGRSWDPAAAARFGREVRTPLITSGLTWLDKADTDARPLPPDTGTLFPLDAPDHVVVSAHPARRRRGMVVRVQETAGHEGVAVLRHPGGSSARASRTSAVEDELEPLSVDGTGNVSIPVKPYEVVSVWLEVGDG